MVSFSGTRHQLTPSQVSCAMAILSAIPNSQPIGVGCCPTGLDALIAAHCRTRPTTIFQAGSHTKLALRNRTLRMVHQSTALFAFPASSAIPHSGTWLAIGAASAMGIPVFVYSATPTAPFPLFGGITSWARVPSTHTPWAFPGFIFSCPVTQVTQQSLRF